MEKENPKIDSEIIEKIASGLGIRTGQAEAVAKLLDEGCTVPFISRYRKENTGGLDEVQVLKISDLRTTYRNLENRREEIRKILLDRGVLTDDLLGDLKKCEKISEIDALYGPYKLRKKTRGMIAEEKGLLPLAELMGAAEDDRLVRKAAAQYGMSAEEALQGGMDILAERIARNPDNRTLAAGVYGKNGFFIGSGGKDKAGRDASVYASYWDFRERIARIKPHQVLALNRGEKEKVLKIRLEGDEEELVASLEKKVRPRNSYHKNALADGVSRILTPAALRSLRTGLTESAEEHAVSVFGRNLRNLLMQPPIKGTRVLGIDPGIRTGSKCAVLDETGKYLTSFVIYQDRDPGMSRQEVRGHLEKYDLTLIAVGNGTGTREVQEIAAAVIAETAEDREVRFTVVDEDGASVYSAGDIAREEFPDLDLTIRGAVSIGRRLQDPLAELVKIDPRAIGVGLYQHDINEKRLSAALGQVVELVVNTVGVNINTASKSLLSFVSGIGPSLAGKIVLSRDEKGMVRSREELKQIPGMGEKAFEQCAGFLRVPESADPLDNSWVHPESYPPARELLDIARNGQTPDPALLQEFAGRHRIGVPALEELFRELKRPGRDPREDYPAPLFLDSVLKFEDLREGMRLTGRIKNVVNFGAFVDIGIKDTALVHISQMSDEFVRDPMDVLKVGDVREFRVLSLDEQRRRISLSLKKEE